MRRRVRPLVPLALFFFHPCALRSYDITPAALERHIAYLAGDALEGRDSGTPGGAKAEEYIEAEFRAAGLDGVETQGFDFLAGSRMGPENALEVGGRRLPAGSFQPYPFSAPGSGEWKAVFAGYGISSGEVDRDDYAGLDVKGKAVVVLAGSPGGDNPHGKFGGLMGPRAKALKALEKGAAALIVVLKDEGLPPFEGEEVTRDVGIPAMATLSRSAAGPLGLDVEKSVRELDEGRPAGRPLDPPVRIRTDVVLERRTARNVLGWLRARGPEARDEVVIVGAHHDGLGRGGSGTMSRMRRGEIHNGADDNASGVAGVIELARRFRERAGSLRRSVLFITFAAEERGLLGSKWFAEHPILRIPDAPPGGPGSPDQTSNSMSLRPVAFVNMDMIGRLRDQKLMESGLATSTGWTELLAAAEKGASDDGVPPLAISADKSEDLFSTSDHVSIYSILKLPVIFFFTGPHKEYHTPDDDLYRTGPDGKQALLINLEGERVVLGHVEEAVLEIAKAAVSLPYKPGVELTRKMSFKVVLRLMPDYGADVEGMRIAEVTAGGPAERAGLRSGDVIVRFGSTPVRSVQDYMVGLEKAKPGEEVEVEYLREGKRSTAKVAPISLPSDR